MAARTWRELWRFTAPDREQTMNVEELLDGDVPVPGLVFTANDGGDEGWASLQRDQVRELRERAHDMARPMSGRPDVVPDPSPDWWKGYADGFADALDALREYAADPITGPVTPADDAIAAAAIASVERAARACGVPEVLGE